MNEKKRNRTMIALTLPLTAEETAVLWVPRTLDPADWDLMMETLDLMKRALVRPPEPPAPSGQGADA